MISQLTIFCNKLLYSIIHFILSLNKNKFIIINKKINLNDRVSFMIEFVLLESLDHKNYYSVKC